MRDFDPTASEFISSGYIATSRPGGLLHDPAALANQGGGTRKLDAATLQKILSSSVYSQTQGGGEAGPFMSTPTAAFNIDGYNYAPASNGSFYRFQYDPNKGSYADRYAGQQYDAFDAQGNQTGSGNLSQRYGKGDFMSDWGPFAMVAGGFAPAVLGAGAAAGGAAGAAEAGAGAGAVPTSFGVVDGSIGAGAGAGGVGGAAGAGSIGAGGYGSGANYALTGAGGGGAGAAGAGGAAAAGASGAAGGAGTTNALAAKLLGTGGYSSLIGPAASLAGGVISAGAANSAANTQAQSASDALGVQKDMFNKVVDLNEPFRQGGVAGMNALTTALGVTPGENSGWAMKDFSPADLPNDPGYQFRLQQGQQALDRAAAAGGRFNSGRAMKDITRFSQGTAAQEYGDAFNRFQVSRNAKLAPLQSLAGVGQSAAGTVGNAATGYGANAANLITGAGNARAAGTVGSANAITNALSQGASMYQNNELINRLLSVRQGGM